MESNCGRRVISRLTHIECQALHQKLMLNPWKINSEWLLFTIRMTLCSFILIDFLVEFVFKFTQDIQSYWCCRHFCPKIDWRIPWRLSYFRSNQCIRQFGRNRVVCDCRTHAKCFRTTQCRPKSVGRLAWQPDRFLEHHHKHWSVRLGRRRNVEWFLPNGDKLLDKRHR